LPRFTTSWSKIGVIADLNASAVVALNSELVIKIGYHTSTQYIATFEYILASTPGIPAPTIHGLLETDQFAYTFMDQIAGVSLDKIWNDISESKKLAVKEQLTPIFKSLRSVPKPSVEHGPFALGTGNPPRCIDVRRYSRVAPDPIMTEHDFNQFLLETGQALPQTLLGMAASYLREDRDIVMTHADLHPRNIMVVDGPADSADSTESARNDIKITCIIDWEVCGWYPSYWEYVKALNTITAKQGTLDWYRYLPTDDIGTFGQEFAVDQLIDRRL
jgi:hypothetical protein